MNFRSLLAFLLLLTVALPAQAQQAPVAEEHEWPFEESDLPPDPAYRFGRLDNGMRYIVRPNATPKGTGIVQFWIDAGMVIAVLVLVTALVTLILTWPTRRRRGLVKEEPAAGQPADQA